MAEFHFLRPLWLLVLPLAIWAAWRIATGRGGQSGWRAVVDTPLQPYVLADGESVGQRRWPLVTALAAAAVAALALAGPTWDRLPVPAYRSDEALVVALDLSRSMDATDVAPTRLERAKLKLLDLLERREAGQTALVVFTSNAFTVAPLTNDTRTIALLVNALSSDIMPSQGSVIEVGLEKAAALLRQSGVASGEILLITDAVASEAAFDLAARLAGEGFAIDVLGVGTAEGAPIPNTVRGFLTDAEGNLVLPRLDADNLARLAAAGHGRFARLEAGDSDLDRLLAGGGAGSVVTDGAGTDREADVWRDQGIWLALAVLPLVALAFRRGWVYVFVGALLLPPHEARALDWSGLWQRPDQQGIEALLEHDQPEAAAELFEDPEWAAVARYRAGHFDASAAALDGIDSPDANYNRGNALARSGDLAGAIAAYDRALELDPAHADAEHNRQLVADLLEQQPPEGEAGDDGEPEPDEPGREQAAAAESGGDEAPSEDQGSEPPADPAQSGQEARAPEPPDAGESGQEQEPGDAPLAAAASPEEIEDWASQQAAEQWLRRIPQDPGGLLRRKFLYQYQQLGIDQDGNRIYPGSAAEPW